MSEGNEQALAQQCDRALQRICKWRTVYTGRILGTRGIEDQQARGYRDLFEKLILLRVEVSALTQVLLANDLITREELQASLVCECAVLEQAMRRAFPGFKASDYGLDVDAHLARDTTQGWPK